MAALPNCLFEATLTDQPFLADEDQLIYAIESFKSHTPFHELLSIIYFLPYSWRKLILDACRIQRPIFGNSELRRRALELKETSSSVPKPMSNRRRKHLKKSRIQLGESLEQYTMDPNEYLTSQGRGATIMTLEDIDDLLQNVYDNSVIMSLLSYFVRAEGTSRLDEFLAVNEQLIQKEVAASQLPNRLQELDYTYLFHEEETHRPVHKETDLLPSRVRKYIQSFLSTFRASHGENTREMDATLFEELSAEIKGIHILPSLYSYSINVVPFWYNDVYQHLYGDRSSVNVIDWETRDTILKSVHTYNSSDVTSDY